MTSDNHSMLKISSCSIVDSVDEVDLGSEITLECIVCSTSPMDLTGEILLIKNQEHFQARGGKDPSPHAFAGSR